MKRLLTVNIFIGVIVVNVRKWSVVKIDFVARRMKKPEEKLRRD
jgi:hypothetical protein